MVHTIEIIATLDESALGGCEGGEACAELGTHGGGVLAVVDGIGEPGDGEVEAAFAGGDVFWVEVVPGVCPIACTLPRYYYPQTCTKGAPLSQEA